MIGWYVHHRGHGHVHRARAVAQHLEQPVTGLSSLPRPTDWFGDWVQLADDTDTRPRDVRAGGALHWVPLGHPGLRSRTARVAAWIEEFTPSAVVVDVSVEITLLVRLHGVPVISFALPGERGDRAHRLGYDVSSAIIAAWPQEAGVMLTGLPDDTSARVHRVGGISRFPVSEHHHRTDARSVVALFGSGGDDLPAGWLAEARSRTPGWSWTVLGGRDGRWLDDPRSTLTSASVVLTHAGQNAVAEVAAARRPAVIVPQARPHAEQVTTGRALADPRWPTEVVTPGTGIDWPAVLDRVSALDGDAWSPWCDGQGAARAARVIEAASLGGPQGDRT